MRIRWPYRVSPPVIPALHSKTDLQFVREMTQVRNAMIQDDDDYSIEKLLARCPDVAEGVEAYAESWDSREEVMEVTEVTDER